MKYENMKLTQKLTPVGGRSAESKLSSSKMIFMVFRFVWLQFQGNLLENG